MSFILALLRERSTSMPKWYAKESNESLMSDIESPVVLPSH